MSPDSKKSIGGSLALVVLGLISIYAGARSLVLLIPMATLVWYGARPLLRGGRN